MVFRWLAALSLVLLAFSTLPAHEILHAYVGTYTGGDSKGVYRFEFNTETGELTEAGVTEGVKNPSFLALNKAGTALYCVAEISDFGGKKSGGVAAFARDAKTGELRKLSEQSTGGAGPCHLTLDNAGKHLLSANYGGGSIAVHPITANGGLGERTDFVQHEGSSVTKRQTGPHAHCINVDAADGYVFATDLGLDQVVIYRYDAKTGKVTPNDPKAVVLKPGAGPRHFAMHPSEKLALVNNELDSTVTSMKYDAAKGSLTKVDTLSTLPTDYQEPGNSTAEIAVSPDGKFVYVSNRGHNSIAGFAINQDTGKLKAIGHTSTGGEIPRNFGMTPDGEWIIAANQKSGTLVVLKRDAETGGLKQVGDPIACPKPVCVVFAKPAH